MHIEGYVVTVACGRSCWRPCLSFVGTNVDRLCESQLKSATRAAALQHFLRLVVLRVPDARDIASDRTVARTACFLTIDTEIGVVGQKVELVAESFDYGAGKILRLGHGKVVEGFVEPGERAVVAREVRQMNWHGLGVRRSSRIDSDNGVLGRHLLVRH